jgi:hypothetical protein
MEDNIMPMWLVTKVILSGILVMVALIQGCVKIEHTKNLKELHNVVSQENVIVLLRVIPLTSAERYFLSFAKSFFAIKIKDASQAAKITEFASPTKEAGNEGWVYVTLPPGNYSINMLFHYDPLSWGGGRDCLPAYDIEIPNNQPIVYIGSFRSYCKTSVVQFSTILTECQRVDIKDETNEALSVAKKYFSQWGPPAISLAHKK